MELATKYDCSAAGGLRPLAVSRRATRYAGLLCIAAAVAITAVPRAALAHAHLVKSAPSAGAHLTSSPRLIRLWFSEAAEPGMTTLRLVGPHGVVAIGSVELDSRDPLLLAATIDASLSAGKYTLGWRTVAKDDGHPSSGTLAFTIDSNLVTMPVAAPVTTTSAVAGDSARLSKSEATGIDIEAPRAVFARWLSFVAIITVIGVAAFRLLVVPRMFSRDDPAIAASFTSAASARAATLGLVAALVALLAAVLRLYAQQAVVGDAVGIPTILHSFWGEVWMLQAGVAVALCIAFARARAAASGHRSDPAWCAAAVGALGLGITPALSGHAIAAPANRILAVGLDMIHVVAAGGWLGSLFAVAVVGVPIALAAGSADNTHGSLPLVARLVNAFSPIALAFASMVVITGAIAAWLRVGSLAALLHSDYGTVLLIKLGFVLLVLAGGAFNWLRMRGALSQFASDPSVVRTFRRSAWLELTAALFVIAVTAVLVAAQPPIH
jgi:copper transport protein